jgi:hypothetical protein
VWEIFRIISVNIKHFKASGVSSTPEFRASTMLLLIISTRLGRACGGITFLPKSWKSVIWSTSWKWGPSQPQSKMRSRGSSGSIVSDYGLDDRGSITRQRQRIFLLAYASRPALGPTQPPVHWVPRVLFPRVKRGRGVTVTTHPHLVSRLSMRGAIPPLPPCASMACSEIALRTSMSYKY